MKYYFAKLDSNNNVTNVYAVAHKDCLDSDGSASETVGINFLNNLYNTSDTYKQTWKERKSGSRERLYRKNYAGIGMLYKADIDVFIGQQPYSSWTINSEKEWEAPISQPTLTEQQIADNKAYRWDESLYQSDNTKGGVLFDL